MLQNDPIDLLKAKILSDDIEQGSNAIDSFIRLDKKTALDYLITLLDHPNPLIFNRAAIGLHDIGDNRALEPLLTTIKKQENINRNGTLVFALLALDCSTRLLDIFDLLFYGDYEVKVSVAIILDEQAFEFSKADLLNIQDKWSYIQSHPELCPNFERSKEDIEDFVNSYMLHLQK
ncbi:HEAT repeat domain-containing protein [Mucilaginibacter sp. PAMB04168]|uniref:HEAT repeat domain-containing protein n=1 Tax=Mucilaginibacter sp. PAMB04168 TaxID=3138567 RepID=UPI0031F68173